MKQIIFLLVLVLSSIQNVTATPAEVAGLKVGETTVIQVRAVDVKADDSDWHGTGKIVVPSGFVVLSAEPVIISHDEGQFSIYEITQPGYIDVSQSTTAEIKSAIREFSDNSDNKNIKNKLNLLSATFSLSKVLDATTHSEIKWKAHAEGHKYGSDGHIRADIRYTLLRAPTSKDYQKILLELARLSLDSNPDQINSIIDVFSQMIDYSSKERKQ